ncbi:hypothetical protein JR316_0008118 [Psilocybe cubensis]|uniref:Uncharacterized protein n=2 Tax=Psilocybe cubensis TaxID=181762 RepID=A0A8H8CJ05_PSICU|nr:hypothetical protein JR316_0008118 [Psilocybe cubensis]KAH9479524.1 hypothetical protein JR316_0008118 [Psilocybe cubensis]
MQDVSHICCNGEYALTESYSVVAAKLQSIHVRPATYHTAPCHAIDLSQCSEGFYKKEIENDIQSGPSKTAEERKKMLEMLRTFEEQVSNGQSLGDESEEDDMDDGADLAKRFETVDLDSVSPETLWSMLTEKERVRFMKAFDDPASELAQQLLASEQLEKEIKGPWWDAPEVREDDNDQKGTTRRYGTRPSMMDIPASMVKAVPTGHPLVFNVCAICIAYAYITRHLGTSPLGRLKPDEPEYQEARRLVSQLVPFLIERKSTQLYPDVPSVITEIWSLVDAGTMTSDLFAVLLRDAARLMKPLRITQIGPSETVNGNVPPSHPHCMPVLVLSDLDELLGDAGRTESTGGEKRRRHITHKIRFYGIHILSTPSGVLERLGEELMARARGYTQ